MIVRCEACGRDDLPETFDEAGADTTAFDHIDLWHHCQPFEVSWHLDLSITLTPLRQVLA